MARDKPHGQAKPAPPKELSTALKGLRFMARKENKNETKISREAKGNSTQWELPEVNQPNGSSVFVEHPRRPQPIVFRNALSFSQESDALAELSLRERSRRKSRRGEGREVGRYRSKDQRVYDQEDGGDDDDSSVSTIDDSAVAQHFSRNKKKRRAI